LVIFQKNSEGNVGLAKAYTIKWGKT